MQTKLPPQPQEFPMEPDLVSLIESKSFTADQQAFIKKAIQDFRNERAALELKFFRELLKGFANF